jgi:hypothetical protein
MRGAAAIMGAATSYPVADGRRVRLDQAASDRVIVPDLLGYGYSARPGVAYTREFYLLQLRELIDGLGIDGPVHLAGASFGGIVVAEFAAPVFAAGAPTTPSTPTNGRKCCRGTCHRQRS